VVRTLLQRCGRGNYASITCLPLPVREAIIIGLPYFLKNFSKWGSRNGTFNDINNRGMKRPHEMMNLISKRPSSISAVRRRAGERRNIREFHFLSLCFWKPGRESEGNVRKMKTEKQ